MSILEGLLGGFREGTEKSRLEERAEQDRQDRAMAGMFEALLRTDSGELQKYGLMGLMDMASGQATPLKKGLAGYFGGREPHPMLGDIMAGITKASAQATGMPATPAQEPGAVPPAAGGPAMSIAGPTDLPGRLGMPGLGAPPPALEGITAATGGAGGLGPMPGPPSRQGRIFPSPLDLEAEKSRLFYEEVERYAARYIADPKERAAFLRTMFEQKHLDQNRMITPRGIPGIIQTPQGPIVGSYEQTSGQYLHQDGKTPVTRTVIDFKPFDTTPSSAAGPSSVMSAASMIAAYPDIVPDASISEYWRVWQRPDGTRMAMPAERNEQWGPPPTYYSSAESGGLMRVPREGPPTPVGGPAVSGRTTQTMDEAQFVIDSVKANPMGTMAARNQATLDQYGARGHTWPELGEIAAGRRQWGQKGPLTQTGAPPPGDNSPAANTPEAKGASSTERRKKFDQWKQGTSSKKP